MSFHRQTDPKKLNWLNRAVLSFLLRRYRKAQLNTVKKASALTRYADQLGHWDWAIKCVTADVNADWVKDQSGLHQPISHTTAAAPTAPAPPLSSSLSNESFLSAMQITSDAKHTKCAADQSSGDIQP